MKRIIPAAFLMTFSLYATGADFSRPVVPDAASCPIGTAASGPSYIWSDGGFAFEGWICESIYRISGGN
jgi:hypothetical protein